MLFSAASARAADVPPELGVQLVLKVLTYDAAFEQRVGAGAFVVLIPYPPAHADAAKRLAAAATALPVKAMVGRTLEFEAVPEAELDTRLVARHAAALLIPAGTPLENARAYAAIATRHSRYSVTLDDALVPAGVTVGVALNQGKAQVVLNVAAARAIKAEFSPVVMKVARLQQ